MSDHDTARSHHTPPALSRRLYLASLRACLWVLVWRLTSWRAMGEAPRPRSPPRYPDMCGRRRLQLEVQILNREIGFLEQEIQGLERIQPVSRCCKDVDEFVGARTDPLIPASKRKQVSCSLYWWIRSKLCACFSCLCCWCTSLPKPKTPSCFSCSCRSTPCCRPSRSCLNTPSWSEDPCSCCCSLPSCDCKPRCGQSWPQCGSCCSSGCADCPCSCTRCGGCCSGSPCAGCACCLGALRRCLSCRPSCCKCQSSCCEGEPSCCGRGACCEGPCAGAPAPPPPCPECNCGCVCSCPR